MKVNDFPQLAFFRFLSLLIQVEVLVGEYLSFNRMLPMLTKWHLARLFVSQITFCHEL